MSGVAAVAVRQLEVEATAPSSGLVPLAPVVRAELLRVEMELRSMAVPPGPVGDVVRMAVTGRGKLLRPLCVLLASRLGSANEETVRQLSVAAELVHEATLVHDDVVDEGELRRGSPAARILHGNAAAVLAGDWLLVEALRRVAAVDLPDVSSRLHETLARMVEAEAIQLEQRGRADGSVELHDRIVAGKTCALFEWAMFAGATTGAVTGSTRQALVSWATHAGMAFQIVDDLLDVAGDPDLTGKGPWNDLAQGKLSYPLLAAVTREPAVAALLEAGVGQAAAVARALRRTGALDEARDRALAESSAAVAALAVLPAGDVRDGLEQISLAIVTRRR